MFGIYRTLLALMVVAQHTFTIKETGGYAVQAFFSLSGFLMTLLMCEVYRGRPIDFALNRFLRIFPAYWAIAATTAAVILLEPIPDMFGKGPWNWGLPTTPQDIIRNVTFTASSDDMRIIPTSWAVTNELIYYVLIGLGLAATPRRAFACLAVSIVIAVWMINTPHFYFHPLEPALPFAFGASLYHLNKMRWFQTTIRSPYAPIVAVAAALTSGYIRDNGMSGVMSLYLNMICCAPIVLWLYNLRPSVRAKRWDDAIGRLSYPIYLSHFLPRIILMPVVPFWINEIWFQPAIVLLTLVISAAVVFLVDLPIERLRSRIRRRSQPAISGGRLTPIAPAAARNALASEPPTVASIS